MLSRLLSVNFMVAMIILCCPQVVKGSCHVCNIIRTGNPACGIGWQRSERC